MIAWGLFGWTAAAFFAGLWWGEKGRRVASERRESTGLPGGPQAERRPDRWDAEDKALSAGQVMADRKFSENTIRKGVEVIQREAAANGTSISDGDARKQAIAMLSGTLEEEPDLLPFR